MRRIRCLTASAMGGFKINGPPRIGKGLMPNEEDLKSSNKASLPKPTQAGRIETCTELIKQAMKCLENGDKECVVRLIEELVKNQCHDGNVVSKEVADSVRDAAHELWLVSDNEYRCRLLKMFENLGVSRRWVMIALRIYTKFLDRWLARCSVKWKSRTARYSVIERVEGMLRERLGWSEVKMCEELWRFVNVDIDEFRRHNMDLCDWLYIQTDDVYLMGIALSDLSKVIIQDKNNKYVKITLDTTNTIDAVLFPRLLQPVRKPTIIMAWANGTIVNTMYRICIKADKWKWMNFEELIKQIRALKPKDIPRLIAGVIDGDGLIDYFFAASTERVEIVACKACKKRIFLDILQEALDKLGIKGNIYEGDDTAVLIVFGENAIKLLRFIMPYLHHPLRRLRAKLLLAYHVGNIDYKTFVELYEQTKYRGKDDPKRNKALEVLARAAPQTHTHGCTRHGRTT